MTIDEAISHAREVAECQKMSARLIEDNAYIPESVDKEAITYGNTICANEHEQLAEWLEELQKYRQIGTLEECLRNKDFLDFLSDKMNPNDFEIYLRLYNALKEKGCE